MTNNTKFTPGPWVYSPERDTHDCVIHAEGADLSDHCKEYGYIDPDGGGVIGSSEITWLKPDDARIIATSPELYAELERCHVLLNELLNILEPKKDFGRIMDQLSANSRVLAKARGE